jgi:glycosyltransferase involved in cell wall biosynthesis
MKIAIITAGGAGMFCGSCMQDNTLVRALRMADTDALLLPTYTPIRVDEENASDSRVFLGGINVYLDSKLPGWRFLPRSMKRWLDRPSIVKWLSKRSSSTNAADLGSLTIDLLKGNQGPQRQEIQELIQYLVHDLRPDLILFSNALLSGIVPELRRQFSGRLCCLLQGDDIFLDALPEPWKSKAMQLVSSNASHFDQVLTHSQYYSQFMQQYLSLPASKLTTIPLTIDDADVVGSHVSNRDETAASSMITVGYFARICPEKGAFRFLDAAAATLKSRDDLRFVIGGFLPELHRAAFEKRLKPIQEKFGDRLHWAGSPADREDKMQLIRSFDWLCVPTIYHEPKGLYVLEAALAGVPSIVPNHGAFPERIQSVGGGQLFEPAEENSLETILSNLRKNSSIGRGHMLRQNCLAHHGMQASGETIAKRLSGST